MSISLRNNVQELGHGEKTLLLAHGFGCSQQVWRYLIPYLQENYKLILFDYVGLGKSDLSAFDSLRYSKLDGYALDILNIASELNLKDIHFVGHSVSSMIGLLAHQATPSIFSSISMVCPSPCYLNVPPEYYGGFEQDDLEELIDLMDKNYIGWANLLAPLVSGNKDIAITEELDASFCTMDPMVARTFAQATFFSDYRYLLESCDCSTLILQSSQDTLANVSVGEYMHAHMQKSVLRLVQGNGHCLHMTNPEEVSHAINNFIESL